MVHVVLFVTALLVALCQVYGEVHGPVPAPPGGTVVLVEPGDVTYAVDRLDWNQRVVVCQTHSCMAAA